MNKFEQPPKLEEKTEIKKEEKFVEPFSANLYKRLGVDEKATPEEIRKAFIKEVKKYHPDKDGFKEAFQRINEAYQILSDSSKKASYDLDCKKPNSNFIKKQEREALKLEQEKQSWEQWKSEHPETVQEEKQELEPDSTNIDTKPGDLTPFPESFIKNRENWRVEGEKEGNGDEGEEKEYPFVAKLEVVDGNGDEGGGLDSEGKITGTEKEKTSSPTEEFNKAEVQNDVLALEKNLAFLKTELAQLEQELENAQGDEKPEKEKKIADLKNSLNKAENDLMKQFALKGEAEDFHPPVLVKDKGGVMRPFQISPNKEVKPREIPAVEFNKIKAIPPPAEEEEQKAIETKKQKAIPPAEEQPALETKKRIPLQPGIDRIPIEGKRREALPRPPEEPQEPEKLKISIVDVSDTIERRALDIANEKLTISPDKYKGVWGFVKRKCNEILKGNYLREFYRETYYRKALKELKEKGLYSLDKGTKEEKQEALLATAERFISEYDESIHERAGEEVYEVNRALGNRQGEELKTNINDLIREFVQGNIDEDNFEEEKKRLFTTIAQTRGDIFKGYGYADNLLEIAKQLKNSALHEEGLTNLDLNFDFVLGKGQADVRTQEKFGRISGIIDKINKSRIGSLINNELVVAGAVSGIYCTARAVSERLARSKLFSWGSFGATAVMAGGVAGAREAAVLQKEKAFHHRGMAEGGEIIAESKRREKLEESRYETKETKKFIDEIQEILDQGINKDNFEKAIGVLSDVESRIELSDVHKIDLLAYSNLLNVEKERGELDILRAKLKNDLRASATNLPNGGTFNEYLENLTAINTNELTAGQGGIEEKDRIFKKMKNREVGIAFTKGVVSGLVIGAATQEAMSLFSGKLTGVIEGIRGKKPDAGGELSMLEHFREWIAGRHGEGKTPDASKMHDMIFGGGNFKLPEDYNLIQNPDGTANLIHKGKEILHGLATKDGHFTGEALKELQDKGFSVDASDITTTTPTTETVERGAKEWIDGHKELFKDIKRDGWWQNNTDKPDLNELRVWWGGNNYSGFDSDGNIVMTMEKMTPGGSFHDKLSQNVWNVLKEGKLKLLLSLSRETQKTVIPLDFKPDGSIIIPKASELFKLFAGDAASGKPPELLAKFAEVAEVIDVEDGKDKVRLFATEVGEGMKTITETITKNIEEITKNNTILPSFGNPPVAPPPVIPIFGRKPLESIRQKPSEETPLPPYPYPTPEPYPERYPREYQVERRDREREEFYEQRRSPQLKEAPEITLEPNKEINWYLENLPQDYKKELQELASQIQAPMDSKCRVSICIPVQDLHEGKFIGNTLEKYFTQIKKNNTRRVEPEQFEIIMFLNHPQPEREELQRQKQTELQLSEVEKRIKNKKPLPFDTEAVIADFQRKHPEMPIRIIRKEFPQREKFGKLVKLIYDTALIRAKGRENPENNDLIVVTSDADLRDISPGYCRNLIEIFDKEPNIDGVAGKLEWDTNTYKKFPVLHAAYRFWQYLDAELRHPKSQKDGEVSAPQPFYSYGLRAETKNGKRIPTTGGNFAMRSSIYAAIGGVVSESDLGADLELGRMIEQARLRKQDGVFPRGFPIKYALGPWLESSARRGLNFYKQAKPMIWQWTTWGAKKESHIRAEPIISDSEPIETLLKPDTQDVKDPRSKGIKRLGDEINEIIKVLNVPIDSSLVKRALKFLGVNEYEIEQASEGPKIKILDAKDLIKGLKKYPERKQRLQETREKLFYKKK